MQIIEYFTARGNFSCSDTFSLNKPFSKGKKFGIINIQDKFALLKDRHLCAEKEKSYGSTETDSDRNTELA